MNYVDFHCHLDVEEFDRNRRQIVEECFAAGFSRLVTVADPYEAGSFDKTAEITAMHDRVYCTAAAHPHNADQYTPSVEKGLLAFLEGDKVMAVGEAGLDFHYNFSTPENQLKVFKRQIGIAMDLHLPLVIHSRKAEPLVLQTLEEAGFDLPAVFHCYTGSVADAREILARGYYISISGIVTFKKSDELREVTGIVPVDRMFTETDSPYLSPVPFRGKVNTPLRVVQVAEKVAEVKGITVPELNRAVNENLNKLLAIKNRS